MTATPGPTPTIVLVGHGMVGQRFLEALAERGADRPRTGWSCCARSRAPPTTGSS